MKMTNSWSWAALGDKLLDAAGVKALASLPSLDELRGKLIGVLQAPGDQGLRGCCSAGRAIGTGAERAWRASGGMSPVEAFRARTPFSRSSSLGVKKHG